MPDDMGEPSDPWSVDPPDGEPFFLNYAPEMELAAHLAWAACSGPRFAFAFGYPGVGKSSFCERLWWNLKQLGVECAMVVVNCLEVATMPPEDARRCLPRLHAIITAEVQRPMIVMLDEIDSIAPDSPARTTLAFWTMRLIKGIRSRKQRVLMLAATNFPYATDAVIQNELNQSIYFGPPPQEVLRSIIERSLGLEIAETNEITACYIDLCRAQSRVAVTRPLVSAAADIKEMVPNWQSLPSQTKADYLFRMGDQPTHSAFTKWMDENRPRIDSSEGLKSLFGRFSKEAE